MAITLVDSGGSSYDYNADAGSFPTTLNKTTASLNSGDLIVVTVTWGDSTRTVSACTAGGTSITANSTGAALAWSGSSKRQQSFYYVTTASGTVALSVSLSASSDAYSMTYEVFRDSVANTWSFDKRATITGGYGTTPITTAAFSTVGAGVIALFAGHNYYNDTYTANFGSDTYVDKTKKSTGTPAYVNAYYGYRINTAAQTGTTVQTNLLNGGAAAGDAYLGLQALSFTSTPSGGGGTTATVTSAGGIASAQAFGTAVLNNRAFITGTGIASAQVFGSHTVSRLTTTTLTPTGIASAQAFGVATVSNRRSISGTGIASAEAFGVALVSSGSNKTVIASGIASGESFGTATLTFRKTLSMTGIASGSAFGTALVSSDLVAVAFTGVGSSGVGGSGVSNTSVQLASSQGLVQYFTL